MAKYIINLKLNIIRIKALILRYLHANPIINRIYSAIYWSTINIIIWGASSSWLAKQAQLPKIHISRLTCLALWQIVFRVNIESAKSLYQELSDLNLVNLFASPIKLSQWIWAITAVGLIETLLITTISTFLIFVTYSINILNLGLILLPTIALLFVSGLSIGLAICGLILNFGKKSQDFLYSFGYIFTPFSAIFYPIDDLPKWAQFISKLLPTSYVFEFLREYIYNSKKNYILMEKSLLLNLIYLILSILFFYSMFKKSKKQGLLNL